MNYIKDILKVILEKIRTNKRLMYLLGLSIILLFYFALNMTFAVFSASFTTNEANVKIGDMKYIFAINNEFSELKSDIYDDHIIRIKPGNVQRYYVSITAQNKYSSKYELYYKVCQTYNESTNTCTYQNELPSGVKIAFAYNTPNSVSGTINGAETKVIILYAENTSDKDAYLYLSMNGGYTHNELETLGAAYSKITEKYLNPSEASFELKTIIAYADGEEVESYEFPSHGNFSLKMTCYDKDGNLSETANADGYWSGTQWVVNVNSATESSICYAKFTSTTTPIPNFQYLVNGSDVSSDQSYVKAIDDGDGNWRIKFFESGTFVMTYPEVNYIDVFVVGGGGGGGGGYSYNSYGSGGGGGGGYTNTCKFADELNSELITISKNIEYTIIIGSGGSGGHSKGATGTLTDGGTGSASSGFDCAASGGFGGLKTGNNANGGKGGSGGGGGGIHYVGGNGGTDGGSGGNSGTGNAESNGNGAAGQGATTREFGETTGELYAGGGGGGAGYVYGDKKGGAGGAGGGGKGYGSDGANTAGTKNTGGGGGGAHSSSIDGGSGGSGIVIIRNHRV